MKRSSIKEMEEKNMAVAYLDLLGTSQLLELPAEVKSDNENLIYNVINTRYVDGLFHRVEENKEMDLDEIQFGEHAKKNRGNSFIYKYKRNAWWLLGSYDLDLFVNQVSNLMATCYISSSEPFRKKFEDLFDVNSNKNMSKALSGFRFHKAFPVLLRGGLALCIRAYSLEEFINKYGQSSDKGYEEFVETYMPTVSGEYTEKGPRLFCDKAVSDNLKDKKLLRVVNESEELYEIVWTIEACEDGEYSKDKWRNIQTSIDETMLPAAINYVLYYNSNQKFKEVLPQYKELLKLVCRGIVRYADINCNKAEEALQLINKELNKDGLDSYEKTELLEGFF